MTPTEEHAGRPVPARRTRLAREIEAGFAARVRQVREEQGISQTALARMLQPAGISIDGTAITRMEKNANGEEGARTIRLAEAVAISSALGCTLDEMLRPSQELSEQIRLLREQLTQAETTLAYAQHMRAELASKLSTLEEKSHLHLQREDMTARSIEADSAAKATFARLNSAEYRLEKLLNTEAIPEEMKAQAKIEVDMLRSRYEVEARIREEAIADLKSFTHRIEQEQ